MKARFHTIFAMNPGVREKGNLNKYIKITSDGNKSLTCLDEKVFG